MTNPVSRVTAEKSEVAGHTAGIKALNRYAERGQPRLNTVSKEEWDAAMDGFERRARYDAANLAAHNWDVTLVGDEMLICSPWSGGKWWVKGSDTPRPATSDEYEQLYPRVGDEYHDPAICWEGTPSKKVFRTRYVQIEWIAKAEGRS